MAPLADTRLRGRGHPALPAQGSREVVREPDRRRGRRTPRAHALLARLVSTVWRRRHVADLAWNRNPAQWVEFSVSSSLMIVLIAQLVAISDIPALAALWSTPR